jgi:hypothetical protein
MCGCEFEHRASTEATYCSNTCRYEGRRVTERPADVHDLLHELYVEEDFDRETSAKRARANLGHDSEWSVHDLETRILADLAEDPLADFDLPDHVTADRVREVADGAETVHEVAQDLRVSYDRVRRALGRLDLLEPLQQQRSSVIEAARENLGLDEDGNVVDVPDADGTDWSKFSGRGGDEA